MQLTTRSNYSD